jgi:hypothetical protein
VEVFTFIYSPPNNPVQVHSSLSNDGVHHPPCQCHAWYFSDSMPVSQKLCYHGRGAESSCQDLLPDTKVKERIDHDVEEFRHCGVLDEIWFLTT